jgi:hypothetical protein
MTTTLDIACDYIARGWNPVPIPHRTKAPRGDGWQHRRITVERAPQWFNGAASNIGVQLGAVSNGLTDIDLDCAETITIAPYILPPTKAIFGRPSKRNSHRLYITTLSGGTDAAAIQLKDPRTKGVLLELRIGGGDKGAQTVFPGSVHPDGEPISWEENGKPAAADGEELTHKVRLVAACALMARYWPGTGGRHDAALVIGGFLARCGHHRTQVKVYAEAVANAAGDPEWRDRRQAAEDAAIAHGVGKNTYGFNAMRDTFGQDIADKIAEWLDYRGGDEPAPTGNQDSGCHSPPSTGALLKSARASTFELSAINWLWPDRFAIGKLGILAGLPDEGKGQIFSDMAARVTRGLDWPCEEGRAPQGNVILLSAEDDPSDTVVPRLLAANADLECIEIVSMVRDANKDRMFSLVTDLALLRRKIADVGNVKLVQIDPISAYLGVGKIDSFRTTDVRAVLAPVVHLAAELKVAIIGIMHFNKKVDVTNALLRISDSLAFGATARHVYAVVDDPENKRKLFVRGKNNVARADLQALAYTFGLREVGHDRRTGAEVWAPHIIWHPQHVDVTASEAMQAATESRSPAARDEAKKFLAELLAAGPMPKADIEDAAEGNGIAPRTLRRAKTDLGVIAKKDGENGGWTWRLPSQPKHWND